MKRSGLVGAVFLLVVASQSAPAAFIDTYDVANWTVSRTGDPPGGGTPAGVDTGAAPDAVKLIGGNDGCFTVGVDPCTVRFTVIAQDEQFRFHWDFSTQTDLGSADDQFGYLVNSGLFQLTDDFGPAQQSGDAVVHLAAGDSFGFYLDCQYCDSIFNAPPGTATVSGFVVPEPTSVALLGFGFACLALARKRVVS